MREAIAPRVSVVVASHRSAYVNILAGAIMEQLRRMSGAMEAIVVADYPVDRLQSTFPQIRWLFCDDSSISAKRNRGVETARGEILAFIDDDCIPSPDWVEQGLLYLDKNKEMAGCEGKTIIESPSTAAPITEFRRLERPGFRTNNIFYRKEIFCSAGGFDERFTVQREDADIAFSIISLGYSIGYCRDAVVRHRVRAHEKWDLLKNCINRRFDPLLCRKHPFLYRKHIGSPLPPGIGILAMLHTIFCFTFPWSAVTGGCAVALDMAMISVLTLRRNCNGHYGFPWIIRDFISFLIAPFVLIGALIYGSIKFKKLLLF